MLTAVGDTVDFTYELDPSNYNYDSIAWLSSNTDAVTIVDGVATAVEDGQATITATINGITSNAITVSVEIDRTAAELAAAKATRVIEVEDFFDTEFRDRLEDFREQEQEYLLALLQAEIDLINSFDYIDDLNAHTLDEAPFNAVLLYAPATVNEWLVNIDAALLALEGLDEANFEPDEWEIVEFFSNRLDLLRRGAIIDHFDTVETDPTQITRQDLTEFLAEMEEEIVYASFATLVSFYTSAADPAYTQARIDRLLVVIYAENRIDLEFSNRFSNSDFETNDWNTLADLMQLELLRLWSMLYDLTYPAQALTDFEVNWTEMDKVPTSADRMAFGELADKINDLPAPESVVYADFDDIEAAREAFDKFVLENPGFSQAEFDSIESILIAVEEAFDTAYSQISTLVQGISDFELLFGASVSMQTVVANIRLDLPVAGNETDGGASWALINSNIIRLREWFSLREDGSEDYTNEAIVRLNTLVERYLLGEEMIDLFTEFDAFVAAETIPEVTKSYFNDYNWAIVEGVINNVRNSIYDLVDITAVGAFNISQAIETAVYNSYAERRIAFPSAVVQPISTITAAGVINAATGRAETNPFANEWVDHVILRFYVERFDVESLTWATTAEYAGSIRLYALWQIDPWLQRDVDGTAARNGRLFFVRGSETRALGQLINITGEGTSAIPRVVTAISGLTDTYVGRSGGGGALPAVGVAGDNLASLSVDQVGRMISWLDISLPPQLGRYHITGQIITARDSNYSNSTPSEVIPPRIGGAINHWGGVVHSYEQSAEVFISAVTELETVAGNIGTVSYTQAVLTAILAAEERAAAASTALLAVNQSHTIIADRVAAYITRNTTAQGTVSTARGSFNELEMEALHKALIASPQQSEFYDIANETAASTIETAANLSNTLLDSLLISTRTSAVRIYDIDSADDRFEGYSFSVAVTMARENNDLALTAVLDFRYEDGHPFDNADDLGALEVSLAQDRVAVDSRINSLVNVEIPESILEYGGRLFWSTVPSLSRTALITAAIAAGDTITVQPGSDIENIMARLHIAQADILSGRIILTSAFDGTVVPSNATGYEATITWQDSNFFDIPNCEGMVFTTWERLRTRLTTNSDPAVNITLGANIDAESDPFFGEIVRYAGTFDGQDNWIVDMHVGGDVANAPGASDNGMFRSFGNGVLIQNVTFINPVYSIYNVASGRRYGFLAGEINASGRIENVHISNIDLYVAGSTAPDVEVATMIGAAIGTGAMVTIERSSSTGAMTVAGIGGADGRVGGLIGGPTITGSSDLTVTNTFVCLTIDSRRGSGGVIGSIRNNAIVLVADSTINTVHKDDYRADAGNAGRRGGIIGGVYAGGGTARSIIVSNTIVNSVFEGSTGANRGGIIGDVTQAGTTISVDNSFINVSALGAGRASTGGILGNNTQGTTTVNVNFSHIYFYSENTAANVASVVGNIGTGSIAASNLVIVTNRNDGNLATANPVGNFQNTHMIFGAYIEEGFTYDTEATDIFSRWTDQSINTFGHSLWNWDATNDTLSFLGGRQ